MALAMSVVPERAMAQRPLGIDVSSFQSSITWSSVKSSGIAFAWSKATEGLTYQDAYFVGNENNGKAAGVYMGPYHYCHPELNTAASEASYFWSFAGSYIKNDAKSIMPMLDVEGNAFGGNVGASSISDWINQWCNAVVAAAAAQGVTVKPVIYISACNANHLNTSVAQWIPWIADYNGQDPQTSTPWTVCNSSSYEVWGSGVWNVWQYTSSGSIPGISGNVDHDVFNGTAATLGTTLVIGGVGNSATLVSSSVPTRLSPGQTFTASITMENSGTAAWTNTGANPYRLGAQSPQDNTTWGFNRVALPASPINSGQNATFTFTPTAPPNAGSYTFAWKMLQEGVQWFGDTFTTTINVVLPGPGTNFGNYTIDTGNMNPTAVNSGYTAGTVCSASYWRSPINASGTCTFYDRDIRWMPPLPTYGFTGRGHLWTTALVPSINAVVNAVYHLEDAAGNDTGGITGSINQCAYSCTSPTLYDGDINVTSLGGWRSNTKDDSAGSGCTSTCGSMVAGYSTIHIYGSRWQYLDDWTCLGGYASTNVTDTSNRSFNEASLYLYPAVDTSHGNAITAAMGLNGKTPGRLTTGDCNNANVLDFKANANAFGGGDNMDAYAFAWVFAPSGAGPKFAIGSDDGNRVWVNGSLINDNNSSRGLTRDQDVTAGIGLPAGWSRVLFKVHNFGGGFQGTMSLRNGSDQRLNEPSVNYYDLGGYYSYSLGYEQDAWYPQIVVNSVYGVSTPVNASAFYGNNTTVTASGTSNGQGPVPYWRTMHYQWGYGLGSVDSNYADVSGTPTATSWSHSTSGVTGHRRFLFFAVSRSGRTSFQNNGQSGGSRFQDAGNYARYYDLYVDNVPPQNPGFSSVTAANTTQINLGWTIPLDQGVNVAPGSTESAGAAGNQDSQNWYRVGSVGVQVYRNGSVISTWGTGTTNNDTGLTANTAYTYTLEARDNNAGTRGAWNNSTGQQGTNTAWTLSVPPTAGSITTSQTNPLAGSNITWTAVGGFGAGKLQYYRYAWDQSATHTFTDTETQWSSGDITTVANSGGNWYLHVKGYNGADIGNGTYDYPVTVPQTQAPQILTIGAVGGTVTLAWSAVSGSTYRVQYTPDLGATTWTALSPDVTASGSTASTTDNTGGAVQRFYRVLLLP